MKKLIFLLFLYPAVGQAHPGVGIVKDTRGNIFYTDLHRVWKITKGNKSIIAPNVHTHELYVDNNDDLYGEGGYYDEKAKKFYHYLWVYRPNGKIDTVIGMKEQYVQQDFSLTRDKKGNEYYLKRFLPPHTDTSHIYRKSPDGNETVFASGDFKKVNWLHPQDDGTLLYVVDNAIYKIDGTGTIKRVKDHVGNTKPSFKFSENNILIWGVWQDNAKNIYAAVFSDQSVKKIDVNGNMTEIYKSKGNWTPLHGVFDDDDKLWVLESSDKNDVRVTMAEAPPIATYKPTLTLPTYILISCIIAGLLLFYLKLRNIHSGHPGERSPPVFSGVKST